MCGDACQQSDGCRISYSCVECEGCFRCLFLQNERCSGKSKWTAFSTDDKTCSSQIGTEVNEGFFVAAPATGPPFCTELNLKGFMSKRPLRNRTRLVTKKNEDAGIRQHNKYRCILYIQIRTCRKKQLQWRWLFCVEVSQIQLAFWSGGCTGDEVKVSENRRI